MLVERQLNVRSLIWHLFPGLDLSLQLTLVIVVSLATLAAFLLLVGSTWPAQDDRFGWKMLAFLTVACLTAYQSHLVHLYLFLPPAAALLVRDKLAEGEPMWYAPIFAVLLSLPLAGFILMLASGTFLPYHVAAWITALGALVVGVAAGETRGRAATHIPGPWLRWPPRPAHGTTRRPGPTGHGSPLRRRTAQSWVTSAQSRPWQPSAAASSRPLDIIGPQIYRT